MTATDRLAALHAAGQSIWIDSISRTMLDDGSLEQMVQHSSVTGLTSNPTIFEKAIAGSSSYDAPIASLVGSGTESPLEIALALFIDDIQRAAAILRPVYDLTRGADGYVSLEVPPSLAHDTKGTIAMAKELWKRVDRPNLMIKIPATEEGIPAIEACLTDGLNINVTLIFSLEMYEKVIDAYTNALISRHNHNRNLRVHSVASFFVSRVDTLVDAKIDAAIEKDPSAADILAPLRGTAAVANASLAYRLFEKKCVEDEEFQALMSLGAFYQRPLWASTSTKNPAYSDVLYVDGLVAPHTVNTMPASTLQAFADHGSTAHSLIHNVDEAESTIGILREHGIDMDDVTAQLLHEGLDAFSASFDLLLERVIEKSDSSQSGVVARFHAALEPAIPDGSPTLHDQETARRIWKHDPKVWKQDPEHGKIIGNRLGWLDVMSTMEAALPRLAALRDELVKEGIRDVVLLGMGGSSLCPEVFRTSFGKQKGFPTLHVIDTTDPDTIQDLLDVIDIKSTVFIVASKSGSTLETRSHFAFFHALYFDQRVRNIGKHFIAITDPGSPLQSLAEENGFRAVFENPATIGGRYSALSFFGLVPLTLMGGDTAVLLERAKEAAHLSNGDVPPRLNPGLLLGAAFAGAYRAKRDKITILCSPRISSFSLWAEQLIAESTGKEGTGLIPIGDEPLGAPEHYSSDRLFVILHHDSDHNDVLTLGDALEKAGHPVIRIALHDTYDLGAEFFRWEFATAVAGAAIGIDPFDEPNVKESKDNTNAVLAGLRTHGLKDPAGVTTIDSASCTVSGTELEGESPEDNLLSFLSRVKEGDYVCLQAYVPLRKEEYLALQTLRAVIRDTHRIATTMGFGPRFLHSTGQLHKGGPNTGHYVQIVTNAEHDAMIPGSDYTFDTLKLCQALGDLTSLMAHGRRVIRFHCNDDVARVLRNFAQHLSVSQQVRS